jgi:serine/threonine protein kinase
MTDFSLAAALQDRYVLERELGHGGMATVYLARDLKHKRPVALKVLRPELAATVDADRFRREIETAARLQHPHICSVYDSGEAAGWLWFTMPYVAGESLRERLRREGRLDVEQALRITTEAGRALAFAHREGFIHRDVKPENILLTADGETLVADFGIARALISASSTTGEHLTDTGTALGTLPYMAPEQAMGQRGVDARADQYSLAATCYEMLVGRPRFIMLPSSVVVAEHLGGEAPSARAARPDVSEAVDQALGRALAFDPGERFGSVADFIAALTRSAAPARAPIARSWRRTRPGLGAVALLALLAVGALILARRSTAPDDPSRRRLAVLPFENQGDSANVYFADGMTDEVRGKLTAVPGLEVIASGSSSQYRRTSKVRSRSRVSSGRVTCSPARCGGTWGEVWAKAGCG